MEVWKRGKATQIHIFISRKDQQENIMKWGSNKTNGNNRKSNINEIT